MSMTLVRLRWKPEIWTVAAGLLLAAWASASEPETAGHTFVPADSLVAVTRAEDVPDSGTLLDWSVPETVDAGGTLSASVSANNLSDDPVRLTIRYSLQKDASLLGVFDGASDEVVALPKVGPLVEERTIWLDIPPRSLAVQVLEFKRPVDSGAYLLGWSVEGGGLRELSYRHIFCKLREQPELISRDSRIALNAANADLTSKLRELGVGFVRFENGKWPFVSAQPHRYSFTGDVAPWHASLDRIFETYHKSGLGVLSYMFLTPEWASSAPADVADKMRLSFPPEDLSLYGEFCFQMAARYGSRKHSNDVLLTADKRSGLNLVKYYEMWNEPNLNPQPTASWGGWAAPMDTYYQMMRFGAEAVKRADPNAVVTSAGYAGMTPDIVDRLRTYRYPDGKCPLDFVDVINVHFYSGQEPPETCNTDGNANVTSTATFPENLRDLVEWRDRHAPSMPIWMTETGYDSGGPFGTTEAIQAARLPRGVMLCLANGIEKVFVYRESGSTPSRHACSGVLRNDFSRKPSWYTLGTLIRQLHGVSGGARRLPHPDQNVWLMEWDTGGEPLLTVWAVDGKARLAVELGPCSAIDSFGGVVSSKGTTDLLVTPYPLYLRDFATMEPLQQLRAEFGRAAVAKAARLELKANDWTPITCVPVDLPTEILFESVQSVDDFESAGMRWQTVLGDQNAQCEAARDSVLSHGGQSSLQLKYDFRGKPDYEYIQLNTALEIPEAGYAFGFWMDDDGAGFPTRLRIVDSSGETHQVELYSTQQRGWQFVTGLLDGPTTCWGGDGNRRRDYPCRLVGICLDRPQRGFVGKGSIWIDDVALLRARSLPQTLKIAAKDAPYGYLFSTGQSVALKMSGEGDQIRWFVEDFWNNTLASGEGPATGAEARFTLDRPGYFSCQINLFRGGELLESKQFCCAALAEGAEPSRSDFVGVCSHYGQNNYPLPSMNLMQRYGIDQFRDEISWRSYETQRGRYVMPPHAEAYLARAEELKMRPLIIFDYNNPLYDNDGFPNSPDAIAAFAAYAVDLAKQTQGVVNTFEVWNEWIGGCGMGSRPGKNGPEDYGRLLKPTCQAVKNAFPDLTIVGIGGEYGPHCADNILGALSVAGTDAMDGWSIHPYRYPKSPESSDLVSEVKTIAGHVAEVGAKQPAWITEIGWPTHRTSGGSDEKMQARYCVRTLALLQATGIVEKVYWYDFKDDGIRRDYNEHNFGLIRHQTYHCAPKPGVVAMSVFIRMTGQAKFQDLRQEGSVYLARYDRGNGTDVVAAWTTEGSQRVALSGQLEGIVDIMGVDQPVSDSLKLTEYPVYLVGRGLRIRPTRSP